MSLYSHISTFCLLFSSQKTKINNSAELQPKMYGQLTIRPHYADLKTDKNFFFKADPYCVFILGNQVLKTTPCKKGGKNPIWNDVVIFERTTEEALIIQLWDRDRITKDDFICEGSIEISPIPKAGVQSHTIDLYNKGVLIGKLYMDIEWDASIKPMPLTTNEKVSGEFVQPQQQTHIHNKF